MDLVAFVVTASVAVVAVVVVETAVVTAAIRLGERRAEARRRRELAPIERAMGVLESRVRRFEGRGDRGGQWLRGVEIHAQPLPAGALDACRM